MFWIDLIFAIVIALLLSSILGWGVGWRHPARSESIGASVLFLFFILMFAVWAGGAWLPVWGPVWYGRPWLGLLTIGVLVSLLVLAVSGPKRPPKTRAEAVREAENEAVVGALFGLFFWLLIMGLLIAAIASYWI